LIKTGQIKFTKKASEKAKEIFHKKKAREFLIVVKSGMQKPSNAKDLYKMLLGVKQDQTSNSKVYTIDQSKAKKLFETFLLQEGRLSLMFSSIHRCALYITKDQQSKYDSLKFPSLEWPTVYLNENSKEAVEKFETKIRTKSIDLADIILEFKGGE